MMSRQALLSGAAIIPIPSTRSGMAKIKPTMGKTTKPTVISKTDTIIMTIPTLRLDSRSFWQSDLFIVFSTSISIDTSSFHQHMVLPPGDVRGRCSFFRKRGFDRRLTAFVAALEPLNQDPLFSCSSHCTSSRSDGCKSPSKTV